MVADHMLCCTFGQCVNEFGSCAARSTRSIFAIRHEPHGGVQSANRMLPTPSPKPKRLRNWHGRIYHPDTRSCCSRNRKILTTKSVAYIASIAHRNDKYRHDFDDAALTVHSLWLKNTKNTHNIVWEIVSNCGHSWVSVVAICKQAVGWIRDFNDLINWSEFVFNYHFQAEFGAYLFIY